MERLLVRLAIVYFISVFFFFVRLPKSLWDRNNKSVWFGMHIWFHHVNTLILSAYIVRYSDWLDIWTDILLNIKTVLRKSMILPWEVHKVGAEFQTWIMKDWIEIPWTHQSRYQGEPYYSLSQDINAGHFLKLFYIYKYLWV